MMMQIGVRKRNAPSERGPTSLIHLFTSFIIIDAFCSVVRMQHGLKKVLQLTTRGVLTRGGGWGLVGGELGVGNLVVQIGHHFWGPGATIFSGGGATIFLAWDHHFLGGWGRQIYHRKSGGSDSARERSSEISVQSATFFGYHRQIDQATPPPPYGRPRGSVFRQCPAASAEAQAQRRATRVERNVP